MTRRVPLGHQNRNRGPLSPLHAASRRSSRQDEPFDFPHDASRRAVISQLPKLTSPLQFRSPAGFVGPQGWTRGLRSRTSHPEHPRHRDFQSRAFACRGADFRTWGPKRGPSGVYLLEPASALSGPPRLHARSRRPWTNDQVPWVLADDRVVAATLTGGERAGRAVAELAGARVKKTVLELGGSDPFIVMPSADLDTAVRTAVTARMINNGQSCIAAKRFIVAEPIATEFERRFVEAVQALRVGDPLDPATDVGPLATPEILKGLDDQVRRSVRTGARVLTGARNRSRYAFTRRTLKSSALSQRSAA
jgi:Aldehyde dehydrogenase family